jgi:hypothetical protein
MRLDLVRIRRNAFRPERLCQTPDEFLHAGSALIVRHLRS